MSTPSSQMERYLIRARPHLIKKLDHLLSIKVTRVALAPLEAKDAMPIGQFHLLRVVIVIPVAEIGVEEDSLRPVALCS